MTIPAEDEFPLGADRNVDVLLAMPDMRRQSRCHREETQLTAAFIGERKRDCLAWFQVAE